VAEGKVVMLGVRGTLSCLDAATGKVAWRKNDFAGAWPQFFISSSPLIHAGLCIAQLGGKEGGRGRTNAGIVAYDLNTGEERWKWTSDAAAYGSPVLMTIEGRDCVIAPTDEHLVALDAASGKVLWQVLYTQGRYNAATPIIDGQTLIYAGPTSGTTAEKLAKQGDELKAEELWRNRDNSLIYNTPVLKDNLLFGISTDGNLFCINTETGDTAWTAPLTASSGERAQPAPAQGRKRRGGGGGGGGYGSVVDAGPVLFALTPRSQLVVFAPSEKEFRQLASYKVADTETYAYPIVSGDRVFVKDANSVTLWVIE
jgi:outer membrane protein assembly factor BamB